MTLRFNVFTGNLDYVGSGSSTSAPPTPTYIPDGDTTTVVEDSQMLAHLPIVIDGTLTVTGSLVML